MKNGIYAGAVLACGLAAATPAAAETDSRDGGIEEVVVTAQRREQVLQDVPIAVTALTSDRLAAGGVTGSVELTQMAPGLNLTRVNAGIVPYIRGIGTQLAVPGVEQAVAVYVDGVYMSSSQASLFSFNNIARVEVLRGPQGTLFGRNATGGLIQVVTKDPQQEPTLDFDIAYSSYKTVTASAYASGGITDKVAASLAVFNTQQGEGWGRNVFLNRETNKHQEFAILGELQINPTDDLSINLAIDYGDQDSDMGINRTSFPGSRYIDGAPSLPDLQDNRYNVISDGKGRKVGAAARITYDFGGASFTSLTAARGSHSRVIYDQDASPLPLVNVNLFQREQSFQQEFLLNGDWDKLQWTLGAFYLNSIGRFDPNATTSGSIPSINIQRFTRIEANSYAVFGQGTYALMDATNLTVGLRYSQENKEISGNQIATAGNAAPVGSVVAAVPGGKRDKTYRKLTWRLSLDHEFRDGVMGYVSYNRGFKSGGYGPVNILQADVAPETLDAFEAGLKSDLFDRQLRLNLSGYYYDYKGIQLQRTVAGATEVFNAQGATSYGVELEGEFAPRLPTGELHIRGSLTLAHGEYDDFPGGPVLIANPFNGVPAGVTCAVTGSAAPGGNTQCTANLSGNRLVRLPDWTASIGAEYAIPVGVNTLTFSADYFHTGKFYFEPDNRVTQKAYGIMNAQVALSLRDDTLRVRAFARNLFDEVYINQMNASTLGDAATAGAPRIFGVGVDFHF